MAPPTILQSQMEFAKMSGFEQNMFWDLLTEKQHDLLVRKIHNLIPSDEPVPRAIAQMREALIENIWAQRKYTNRNSLTSIIYVMVTKEENRNAVLSSTKYSVHPVIRCRKCVDEADSINCCKIFIDEVGRVYQNWQSYLKTNVLPEGTMVAPKRGFYSFNQQEQVLLECWPTPNSSVTSKIVNVADKSAAVGGFLAACVPIAALLTAPVSAPLMGAAAIVGLATAGYSGMRSGHDLIDRSSHEQSISLADSQARGSWIGVVGGAVGLGAAGATRAMVTVASAGKEVSAVTTLVVNGMNISSIIISGTGITNGVIEMILKYSNDEEISAPDVLQLAASLVLFTHSVSNFRLASSIVREAQNNRINSYRDGLSNRQRRMFDKLSKETIRTKGVSAGKMDVIRSINEVPDKQYLNDLFKVNKALNKQGVRPSFGGPENPVVLNNEVPVDTQVLRNSVQRNIGPNVLDQVTKPIPQSHTAANGNSIVGDSQARLLFNGIVSNSYVNIENSPSDKQKLMDKVNKLLKAELILANGVVISFAALSEKLFDHVVNAESFQDIIESMANYFNENTLLFLMELASKFIASESRNLHSILRMHISTETVLYRLLKYCLEKYENFSPEFLETRSQEIFNALRNYFLSMNPFNSEAELLQCKVCSGLYTVCSL